MSAMSRVMMGCEPAGSQSTRLARRACLCGLVLIAELLAPGQPGLASSGDWVRRDHSAVRLLQGEVVGDAYLAGVEFVLGDGWKTYWRMPGESGVPAEFDWSASMNVAAVAVDWPAPHRMYDAAGEGVGYKDQVVFPLTVKLARPGSPARLDLKLFYALCKDICVPASAELSLDLAAAPAVQADVDLIRRYRDLVPVDDANGRGIIAAAARMVAGKPYLAVTVAADHAAVGDVDIFVEGADRAYFRKPQAGRETASGREYPLPVDGITDAAVLSGLLVRITWVAGNKSLSRELRVE
jgi:DsbC/DsbD-like thiol-disulfide interchange protein